MPADDTNAEIGALVEAVKSREREREREGERVRKRKRERERELDVELRQPRYGFLPLSLRCRGNELSN